MGYPYDMEDDQLFFVIKIQCHCTRDKPISDQTLPPDAKIV